MSAHQLMRNLDIKQYKSAWFMAHRIRYALTGELPEQLNGVVEADETYIGGKPRKHVPQTVKPGVRPQDKPFLHERKAAVVSVVQRGGNVYSRHVERVTAENVADVINSLCAANAHLITDTGVLRAKGAGNRKHSLVNHTGRRIRALRRGFLRHDEHNRRLLFLAQARY